MSRILVDQVRSNSASGDAITLDGSGKCAVNATTINNLTFPTSDGSANQLLKTDGSGALSFVAPPESNLKHLSTTTLSSNASNVIISNAFNQYDVYRLYIINVKSTSNDTNLFAKLQDSGGDIAASYHRSRASHAIEANFSNWGEWRLNYAGIANGSNKSWNAIIDYSGSFASPPLRYVGLTSYQHHSDGDPEGDYVNGCYDGTVTNLTGIKFYFSSGSFSGNGGKFMLYGVNNA